MEIKTPYPHKRNKLERDIDRYNHILELIRTILSCATVILQLIILYRLSNYPYIYSKDKQIIRGRIEAK